MYLSPCNNIDHIVCATARATRGGEWQSAARDVKKEIQGMMYRQVPSAARLDLPEFEQRKGICLCFPRLTVRRRHSEYPSS